MTLEEMFQALRGMNTKDLAEQVAKEAAPLLQETVAGTLAKGQTPDGKTWAPTKKGKRAYANAASKVTTKAYGNVIKQTLTGPEVFGHFGFKGAEPRQMIPEGGAGLTGPVAKALDDAATKVFQRAIEGAK